MHINRRVHPRAGVLGCRPKGGLSPGYAYQPGGFISGGYSLGGFSGGLISRVVISGIPSNFFLGPVTHDCSFLTQSPGTHYSKGNPFSGGVKCTRGGKNLRLLTEIGETVRDRPMFARER